MKNNLFKYIPHPPNQNKTIKDLTKHDLYGIFTIIIRKYYSRQKK